MSLTGAVALWIDVGLPEERDLRKACGRARQVKVYAYGRGAALWRAQNREAHPAFRDHLMGRIAWVGAGRPARQARLRELFDRIAF